MNLEQTIRLEDLVAFETRLDFSVEVDEAVNSQFLLHLKVNVAFLALEAQLTIIVLMSNVAVIVLCNFARKLSCAKVATKAKVEGVL